MTIKRHAGAMITILALILASAGAARAAAQTAAGARVAFGPKGVSSIQVAGHERLVSGMPGIWRNKTASGQRLDTKPHSAGFDPATHTLTLAYAWGTMTCRYTPEPTGLRIETTIRNTSDETVTELNINMISLVGLGEKQWLGHGSYGVTKPAMVVAKGPNGALLWCADAGGKPLGLDLSAARSGPHKTPVINCRVNLGGGRLIVDQVTANRPIAPKAQDRFTCTLRLGAAGTDPFDLGQDLIEAYRRHHPRVVNWPDHRPILRLFFGGGLPKDQSIANIRHPEQATRPAPDPKFQQQLLKRMASLIAAAKVVDAQGVIMWDLEGDTFPHATTYIGDPRLVPLLNPQMDLVIDQGMKMLRDAGLRVGVTLRPSQIKYWPSTKTLHQAAAKPFATLDAKVAYAVKRWGCTIFYVDTNYVWRPYPPNGKWKAAQIGVDVWLKLHQKYPHCLFIPEIATVADYQATLPYGEADMGSWAVPAMAKHIWPDARRLIVIEDADPFVHYERFVQSVRAGNMLMTYAYSPQLYYVQAMAHIEKEAALLEAGSPSAVASASPAGLLRLLTSPDLADRYFAARRLANKPMPAAGNALLDRVRDDKEAWIVRHMATLALAKVREPAAVPTLVKLMADHRLGLYHAAGMALAGQGQAAAGPLYQAIAAQAGDAHADARQIQRLGAGLLLLKPRGAAMRLEKTFEAVPPGKSAAPVRRALIEIIGELRDGRSEAFLMRQFEKPDLRAAAAAALARLDSKKGIAQVRAAIDHARKAGDRDTASRLARALRAK